MSSTSEPPTQPVTPASTPAPTLRPPAESAPGSPPPVRRPEWHKLHLFQIQAVRDVLVILLAVGVVYLGYILSPVTVPMLLALALAYLFEPLIQKVTRSRYISRQGAAVAIIVLAGLVVVVPVTLGIGFAAVQGTQYAASLAGDIRALRSSVDNPEDEELRAAVRPGAWMYIRDQLVELEQERRAQREAEGLPPVPESPPGAAPEDGSQLDEPDEFVYVIPDHRRVDEISLFRRVSEWVELNAAAIGQAVGRRAIGTGGAAVNAAIAAISGIGYLLFAAVLTAFFFFFFSTGWGQVLAFWEGLVPEKKKGRVLDLVRQMDRVIAGFVRGRLTIVGLLVVYMTAAYWLIGVPAPLVLGPIVGLLFIVPFVHILGVPVAMLLMWLEPSAGWQGNWWWIVFAPLGVYLIAQLLDDWILSPIIQGKSTDMDTPTILFASLAGGVLMGVYGLLLAIPIAACIKILLKEIVWPRVRAYLRGEAPDVLPIEGGRRG